MIVNKKDFVEIDFTGRVKDSGQIFDTTKKSDAEKIGAKDVHPMKVCAGEGMLVKGFDDSLEGKETDKIYSIEIEPKKAFGLRDPKLVKIVPISVFHEKEINPYPGQVLNIDGILARISSVSGGRVITDFNLPLAGKTIIYDFKILRILEDKEEKLKALAEFFLGDAEAKIENNKAIITSNQKDISAFRKKVKSILGLDAELKIK